jgi:phosphatidylglycerol:prolipoprotein diacylglycerol transferase
MPDGFSIGPLFIHFYGLIIMVGVLAAVWLSELEARRKGQDTSATGDMLIWVLIGGIIGARLWHILTPPPSMVAQGITTGYYLTHPLDAIAIWRGGLGIPGAVAGGILALYLFTRRQHMPFLTWLDIIVPGLALAQAIGRWGNFVNQELYGAPSHLPWAIYIDPQHRLPGLQNQATYQPLFLYESIWDLLNMGFLLWLGRRYEDRLEPGDMFLVYLIIYPLGRFFLEFLRLDASQVAGINANQTLMLVILIVSTTVLILRHRPEWKKGLKNLVPHQKSFDS